MSTQKVYERIKKRRIDLNLSQDDLAALLDYKSRSTIAKIESGKNDITSTKLSEFARALNTTPAYLMGWTDDPSPDIDLENTMVDTIAMENGVIINEMPAADMMQAYEDLQTGELAELIRTNMNLPMEAIAEILFFLDYINKKYK